MCTRIYAYVYWYVSDDLNDFKIYIVKEKLYIEGLNLPGILERAIDG